MRQRPGMWDPVRQAALDWANADSEDDRAFELAQQRLAEEVERLCRERLALRELAARRKP